MPRSISPSLAEPLAEAYTAIGRPAIAPEVVLRALLLGAIYEVSSHRQLCERISENLAWRWFCFMTLDDEVFDHSTLTKFMDRIGPDAFTAVLDRLNESLDTAGLLSHRTYVDSSLIPSAGSLRHLEPRRETDPMPAANREEQVWETRLWTAGDETALPQMESCATRIRRDGCPCHARTLMPDGAPFAVIRSWGIRSTWWSMAPGSS